VTLVLCGSLGATAAMWEPQGELGSGVCFELPGHGAAPLVDGVSIDSLAAQVLERVDGRFSLVGLSLGGAVAMRVAAVARDRVEKLVLACTSMSFGDAQQWRDRARTVRSAGLEAIVDAVMGRWFSPGYPDVARWRAMFLSVEPEGYARCCEALAGWEGSGDLRRIEAPTLVIAGRNDPTSPPPHGEEIVSLLRDARLGVIEDAQHLANVECAEEFNRLLKEHL